MNFLESLLGFRVGVLVGVQKDGMAAVLLSEFIFAQRLAAVTSLLQKHFEAPIGQNQHLVEQQNLFEVGAGVGLAVLSRILARETSYLLL